MRALREALRDALVADTLASTVGAGSTVSVVQLGAGEAASWSAGDLVSFTGAAGSAANNKAVRTITAVDTGTDQITVGKDLAAAPLSGDQVKGGVRDWLYYLDADDPGLYYVRWPGEAPLDRIATAEDERRCIASYGPAGRARRVFDLHEGPWEIRIYGRSVEWVEGCEERILRLLDGKPASLSVLAHDVERIAVGTVRSEDRDDMFEERVIPLRVATSLVHA